MTQGYGSKQQPARCPRPDVDWRRDGDQQEEHFQDLGTFEEDYRLAVVQENLRLDLREDGQVEQNGSDR